MKVKVIKKAERESLGEQQASAPKVPKRRRIKLAVERWVTEIHEKAAAEDRIAFNNFFNAAEDPQHS
ncbi:MAG: hypothetical protein ACJ73D_12210 [Pyrinomonadaceae bacterium]